MAEIDEKPERTSFGDLLSPAMKYLLWRRLLNELGMPSFECAAEIGEQRPRACGRPARIWIGNMEGVFGPEDREAIESPHMRHPDKADGLQFAIPVCGRHMKQLRIDLDCIAIERCHNAEDFADELWRVAQFESVRVGPLANDVLRRQFSLLRRKR